MDTKNSRIIYQAYGTLFGIVAIAVVIISQCSPRHIGTGQPRVALVANASAKKAAPNFWAAWKPVSTEARKAYIRRFARVAMAEQAKFGIPASITLAQGILESKAGSSQLTQRSNNHFGIKCFSKRCHRGHCENFTDDTHKDFFKVYRTPWQSFRDHSEFLSTRNYRHLRGKSTEQYAEGLQTAGYATSDTYAKDLLEIIETCDLQYFDSANQNLCIN